MTARKGTVDTVGAPSEPASWSAELARFARQVDDLKARSDEEYRALHTALDTQFEDMQAALRQLEADMAALRPDARARRVAAHIEQLKAEGDAAYERLQRSRPG